MPFSKGRDMAVIMISNSLKEMVKDIMLLKKTIRITVPNLS